MDKNTLIGFFLIGAILAGFYLFAPKAPQQPAASASAVAEAAAPDLADTLPADSLSAASDSSALLASRYGHFAAAAGGAESSFEVTTDVLHLTFSNKGAALTRAELLDYKTGTGEPLVLFDGRDENDYTFYFTTANPSRTLSTADLAFDLLPVSSVADTTVVTYRLHASATAYLDFQYRIPRADYCVSLSVQPSPGFMALIPANRTDLEFHWASKVRQQEKGRDFEARYSGLFYKFLSGDVENLSESSSETERPAGRLRWVAFKDQFFSHIWVADSHFESATLASEVYKSGGYLKSCTADLTVPFDARGTGFRIFLTPNRFKTLKAYDHGVPSDEQLDLHRLVPLGWWLFRWVNRLIVLPLFNFFGSFISNYGIIILLMTLVIKLILFPLTYKSYMSTAKMRVLKPEIEKINARIPADKVADRQRATMDLYARAGVNPMGGCLPMLLQMPLLIAMFSFFPAAIELRQQHFLWAADLSTYDSILDLPFSIPFYGDHVSLFCLLMTIVNLIYTRVNMAATDTGNAQMPGMKWMMYFMPIMFLFFFNSYASGLTYYYFISLLITIIQTYAIRASVNEQKILAQLNENKKKPARKSGWMARLEQMQREQQAAQRAAASGKGKGKAPRR